MRKCEFTKRAASDLEEIHDFIARNSPKIAGRFIEKIRKTCRSLAESPGMGRKRKELFPGIRSFPIGNYVIFYRTAERGIEVVRVLSSYRDIDMSFLL